jgi:DNA gyrase/topoisomerase IV subunit A
MNIDQITETIVKNINATYKATPEEINQAYTDYKSAVNMSYTQLKAWSETKCSRLASLDRGPINRNLRLLNKKKSDWTAKDASDARKTIAFISRMRKVKSGKSLKDSDGRDCGSKRDISLKNWAYRP